MRSLSLLAVALLACSPGSKASDGGGDGGTCIVCDPSESPDPCETGGEACTPDYTGTSSTGYYCEPPGPFFACLPEVGCAAANLQCIEADAGVAGVCAQTCSTSADCSDPYTVCEALEDGGPTFCLINDCDTFWQPCAAQSADGGDGTCVFFYVDPTYGPLGACLQAGSVPQNGACSYYRGATSQLCSEGTVCMVSDGTAQTGFCMAACDAYFDGGPACQGVCVASTPPEPPPAVSLADLGNQGGGCAVACDGAGDCTPPYSCAELTNSDLVCLP